MVLRVLLRFTLHKNASIERFHNFLTYDKSESNPSRVNLCGSLKLPEQAKQFGLVFLSDTHARIFDTHFEIVTGRVKGGFDFDRARHSELKGVLEQVQDDLVHSFLV